MAKLSKEILDEIEAHNAIVAIENAKELQAFIKGERREPLLDIAAFRINVLKSEPETRNSKPATENTIQPTSDKDTTSEWIEKYPNLQPKQGEVQRIADGVANLGLKPKVSQKPAVRKIMTMRDSAPHWVHFDEDGKEVKAERVPGH